MALNPFFLQGSEREQKLLQDLVNEQIGIYGVEVYYLPRRVIGRKTIIEEIVASEFDEAFPLEAYIKNYEGYSGAGDIMTKFGVSLRDELTLVISKEKYEEFIAPFVNIGTFGSVEYPDDRLGYLERPREGDLIYFPFGSRLFEIKFVEHEMPFYQLNNTYVYELRCELFEYEDEILDTSIDEIDTLQNDEGFVTTLFLGGSDNRAATITGYTGSGYIDRIFLDNDGSGYTSAPTVAISTNPLAYYQNPYEYRNAEAVAITTCIGGVCSVKEILFTDCGVGYTEAPTITITGGGGSGAIATCSISTSRGIVFTGIDDAGMGYGNPPTITSINGSDIIAKLNAFGSVSSVFIKSAGSGFSGVGTIGITSLTISAPPSGVGYGTFNVGDRVTGQTSGSVGIVRSWDSSRRVLTISNVGIGATVLGFQPDEVVVGSGYTVNATASTAGNAIYSVREYITGPEQKQDSDSYTLDSFAQNDQIEKEADEILDFTESNPFGTY